jgi:hypothetical protein
MRSFTLLNFKMDQDQDMDQDGCASLATSSLQELDASVSGLSEESISFPIRDPPAIGRAIKSRSRGKNRWG